MRPAPRDADGRTPPALERRPHGFEVLRLARVHARLVAYDWAWARDNAARIAENWRLRRASRPGLFDGPVLLACDCAVEGDACRVAFFETTYARFLAYRDGGSPDGRVFNAFAALVPWTADGAVLLGEMGDHTANAGQVYFPCGTPDRDDVRRDGGDSDGIDLGAVDLAGSAGREFAEETGLVVPEDARTGEAADWVLLRGEGQLAFLRPVHLPQEAEALCARIEARIRAETDPELARMVVVRGPADIDPARMPGFVRAYLAAAFDVGPGPDAPDAAP